MSHRPFVGGTALAALVLFLAPVPARAAGLIVTRGEAEAEDAPPVFLAVAFSPDSKLLAAGGEDGVVRLFDPETGKALRRLEGHDAEVTALAFAPDGKTLATGAFDGTVRLWDPASGVLKGRMEGHKQGVLAAGFSADGRTVATVSADFLRVWDGEGGKAIRKFEVKDREIGMAAFSPDGKTSAEALSDGTIRLVDVETGEERLKLEGYGKEHHSHVAFSPDGTRVAASAGGERIVVWECKTGKRIKEFGNPEKVDPFAVAFTPDGKGLVVGGTDVSLLDAETGKVARRFSGQTDVSVHAAVSPDGKQVASCAESADRGLRVWGLESGKILFKADGPAASAKGKAGGGQPSPSPEPGPPDVIWEEEIKILPE